MKRAVSTVYYRLCLRLCGILAFGHSLGHTRRSGRITTLDVPLPDPNFRSQLSPLLHLRLAPRLRKLDEMRPIRLVVILELNVPAKLLPDIVRREEPVLDDLGVEPHLVARDGIDERVDELVKGIQHPGDVDDQGTPETFWVMGLQNVQDLLDSSFYFAPLNLLQARLTMRDKENDGLLAAF